MTAHQTRRRPIIDDESWGDDYDWENIGYHEYVAEARADWGYDDDDNAQY